MTPAERAFLERARVAALATVDGEGRPHAVPICFALLEPGETGETGESPSQTDANESQHRVSDDGGDDGGVRIVSAIDEKPKATRELQRVRNVRSNPRVTLLVDRYREDWSRLAWLQVRGRARLLEPERAADERAETANHEAAVGALETKYDQYADHDLERRPVVSIRVDRTVSWGALESGGADS